MNHETDMLPLTWQSFLEKLALNFVNVYILTSNSQFFNSLNDLRGEGYGSWGILFRFRE